MGVNNQSAFNCMISGVTSESLEDGAEYCKNLLLSHQVVGMWEPIVVCVCFVIH